MIFTGFGPHALPFLQALAFHQDKGWFEANRRIYEEAVRAPLEALIGQLSAEFAEAGLPIRGDRRSVFRLHRDTRFGKDKRPYKTNAGAVLSRDGTKTSQGFLYIHLEPGGCFTAAGFWRPQPDELFALRTAIVERPARWRRAVDALAAAGLPLSEGDPLARNPKSFEIMQDASLADAVRRRNLIVRRQIEAEAICSPGLAADLATFAHQAAPLLRFGWDALDRRAARSS